MKKIITVMMMAAALAGCSDEQHISQAEANAIQYARESVFDKMTGVESVSVTASDSVLTDDMIDEQHFETLANDMVSGKVSEDEFRFALDSIGTVLHDIWKTWRGDYYKEDVEGKYPGHWHAIYTVTATMKSGAEHKVRVLMKRDGITPDMTEDEYRNKQKKKQGVLKAVTHELWYR